MMGVPTKLIRKELLVSASGDGDVNTAGLDRLPVYTLTFEIPRGHEFGGRSQPLEDVRIDMGEVVKMVIPNYKPKSFSMSALRDDEFDITIKIYPNGRASGHLHRLQIGETTQSFGMRNLTRRRNEGGTFFGGIAYGVGITEILPVARAELEKMQHNDSSKVVVLWAARTKADLFWNEQIQELEDKYGTERFQMVYIFSREKKEEEEASCRTNNNNNVLYGRIDAKVLETVFDETRVLSLGRKRTDARFLVIGTKPMMRSTEGMLSQIGFPFSQNALFL